jgi:cell division cycle protein 20 (cofactor of APC complex)
MTLIHEQEEYKKQLAGNLLKESNDGNTRILAFRSKPPPPPEGFENSRKLLYTQNFASSPTKAKKMFRHIPQVRLLPFIAFNIPTFNT